MAASEAAGRATGSHQGGCVMATCGCTVHDNPVRADSSFRGIYFCGACGHDPHPGNTCADRIEAQP